MNNYDWASSVMTQAHITPTQNTLDNFTRWMAAENPVTYWWNHENPLNINASGFGYDTFPDLETASRITAQVLSQSNMGAIHFALASDQSLGLFSAAVVASPWASSHYGGDPMHFTTIPLPPVVDAPGTAPAPTPAPAPVPKPTTHVSTTLEELFNMPADNGATVRLMYRFLLHREVDPAGYTANVNWLNGGGSLDQVIANLQDSAEGRAVIAAERLDLKL